MPISLSPSYWGVGMEKREESYNATSLLVAVLEALYALHLCSVPLPGGSAMEATSATANQNSHNALYLKFLYLRRSEL